MTETHVGHRGRHLAPVLSLDTRANGFVAAGVEKCWPRFDEFGTDMHDVFVVISEGADGEQVARTVCAANEDDARQTHRDNYAGETIVAVGR